MNLQITLIEDSEDALLLKSGDEEAAEFMQDFTREVEGDIRIDGDTLVIDTWNGKEHRASLMPDQVACIKRIFGKTKSFLASCFEHSIQLFYEHEGMPIDFGVRRC